MKFGGHETFTIREGWLHKGLLLLIEHPDRLNSDSAADSLGIGRNMAKSLRHWLLATGIAAYGETRRGRTRDLACSELGRLIARHDPHFLDIGTLWILHANLVRSKNDAYSWFWFFNYFNVDRFEKIRCLEVLTQHLSFERMPMPSGLTLERDISCLLGTYSRQIPLVQRDPEEGQDCPFAELGLMVYHRSSGYFELNRREKQIPPEILAYCIRLTTDMTEVSLREASYIVGGPGRTFALTAEMLFELALRAESVLGHADLHLVGLAGERLVKLAERPTLDWLTLYYRSRSSRQA